MWFVHTCVDRDHFKRTGSIHKPLSMTYSLQKAKSSLWHERRKTDTGQTEKYVPKHAKGKTHIQEISLLLSKTCSSWFRLCVWAYWLPPVYTVYDLLFYETCTFISRTALWKPPNFNKNDQRQARLTQTVNRMYDIIIGMTCWLASNRHLVRAAQKLPTHKQWSRGKRCILATTTLQCSLRAPKQSWFDHWWQMPIWKSITWKKEI